MPSTAKSSPASVLGCVLLLNEKPPSELSTGMSLPVDS
jgi:hypothetical protein